MPDVENRLKVILPVEQTAACLLLSKNVHSLASPIFMSKQNASVVGLHLAMLAGNSFSALSNENWDNGKGSDGIDPPPVGQSVDGQPGQ